ncbi:hypothetical protein Tco_0841940 [Tanacetum coccineum]|uniref:Uncharacterized protein n=1 Tax=Tanacetum coccineum TaxID=301880 RepID=A0ABQ5AZ52_9ASTR
MEMVLEMVMVMTRQCHGNVMGNVMEMVIGGRQQEMETEMVNEVMAMEMVKENGEWKWKPRGANNVTVNENPIRKEEVGRLGCSMNETYQGFHEVLQPTSFKGTEGVVGLIRWRDKDGDSVFTSATVLGENQVKYQSETPTKTTRKQFEVANNLMNRKVGRLCCEWKCREQEKIGQATKETTNHADCLCREDRALFLWKEIPDRSKETKINGCTGKRQRPVEGEATLRRADLYRLSRSFFQKTYLTTHPPDHEIQIDLDPHSIDLIRLLIFCQAKENDSHGSTEPGNILDRSGVETWRLRACVMDIGKGWDNITLNRILLPLQLTYKYLRADTFLGIVSRKMAWSLCSCWAEVGTLNLSLTGPKLVLETTEKIIPNQASLQLHEIDKRHLIRDEAIRVSRLGDKVKLKYRLERFQFMLDSDESGVTYREISSTFEGLPDIGSPGVVGPEHDGLPWMPPSPDYIPGPEEP